MKESAGLLMYRPKGNSFEVFLVHPGGPFWKKKDKGAWTIPKGEIAEGEDLLDTAKREFEEETGITAEGDFVPLGYIKQKAGKIVHAWAFKGDWDGFLLRQSFISIEWPPKSGKKTMIPEIDKAGFFKIKEAKWKINPAQQELIDRLKENI